MYELNELSKKKCTRKSTYNKTPKNYFTLRILCFYLYLVNVSGAIFSLTHLGDLFVSVCPLSILYLSQLFARISVLILVSLCIRKYFNMVGAFVCINEFIACQNNI